MKFLFWAFLYSQLVFSLDTNKIPPELDLLFKGIKQYQLTEKEKTEVFTIEKKVVSFIENTPPPLLLTLVKSEIYKSILDYPLSMNYGQHFFSKENFETAHQKYLGQKSQYHLFNQVIIESILFDIQELLKNPNLKEKSSLLAPSEYSKIQKKVNILAPWLMFVDKYKAQEINMKMRPLHFILLNHILNSLNIFSQFSGVSQNTNLTSQEPVEVIPTKNNISSDKERSESKIPKQIIESKEFKELDVIELPPKKTPNPDEINEWKPKE